MNKKIPLGVKILAIFFIVIGASYCYSIIPFVSWVKMIELTPQNLGLFFGGMIRIIVMTILHGGSALGLLRLKKWGIKLALVSLFIGGFFFALGLAEGITTESKGTTVCFVISFIIALLLTGAIIFKIKKYLTKDIMKVLFK